MKKTLIAFEVLSKRNAEIVTISVDADDYGIVSVHNEVRLEADSGLPKLYDYYIVTHTESGLYQYYTKTKRKARKYAKTFAALAKQYNASGEWVFEDVANKWHYRACVAYHKAHKLALESIK